MNNSSDLFFRIIVPLFFIIIYTPPFFFAYLAYKRKHKTFGLIIIISAFFAIGWIPSIILLFLPQVNPDQPKKPISPPPAIFADQKKLDQFKAANFWIMGVSTVILLIGWQVPVNASETYITLDILLLCISALTLCGALASFACIKKGYSPVQGWVLGVCLPAIGFVLCWFRPNAEWKKAGIRPGEPAQYYLSE